jgi:hypothetical protein
MVSDGIQANAAFPQADVLDFEDLVSPSRKTCGGRAGPRLPRPIGEQSF